MVESARKPRLLVVTSTYPRWSGDTEPAFVHQLSSRLVARFDVVVATSRAPGAKAAEWMDGVRIHRYSYAPAAWETLVYGGGLVGNLRGALWKALLLPTYLGCWIWQIAKLERLHRFDVVHVHWFVPGGAVAALTLRGKPICVTAHGTDVLGLRGATWRRLRKFVAGRSSVITVVGKALQEALTTEGISRPLLLPMGVDLSGLFVPPPPGSRSLRLLFVGRLVDAKRPEVVLQAFEEVLKVHTGLHLDMVGNGPSEARLRSLAEELGIVDRLKFHGRKSQAEIAAMYRSAAALVIASGGRDAPEGLGLVVIEALGCGCPVASVPNASLRAALPESAPIRYASDESVEALRKTILDVLSLPVCEVGDQFESWRSQLVQRFDWDAVAMAHARVLNSLLVDPVT